MLKKRLASLWYSYVNSFNHELTARVECHPFNVLLVIGFFILVAAICQFSPPIQQLLRFDGFIPATALALSGSTFSLMTYWVYPNRSLVALMQLFDVPLYASAILALSLFSSAPVSYAFMGIFIAVSLYWGSTWYFTWIRTITMILGPTVIAALFHADSITYILMATGLVLYVSLSSSIKRVRLLIAYRARAEDVFKQIDELLELHLEGKSVPSRVPIRTLLHDIKNELAFASWNMEIISEETLSAKEKEAWSDLKAGVLYSFSKAQAYFDEEKAQGPTREQFWLRDIPQLLQEIPTIKSNRHRLNLAVFPEVSLHGSAAQFVAVLKNVLENAIETDATEISVRGVLSETQNSVLIEISDNGPGIPPVVTESMFTPFNTADKSTGVGLGLYLSRRIIETFGGKIELKETGPKGTTFVVHAPVASEESLEKDDVEHHGAEDDPGPP